MNRSYGSSPWRTPPLWRLLQVVASGIVGLLGRLQVSGDVPDELRRGPLILAANHTGNFDPFVLAAACRARRIAPRIMADGRLFRPGFVGAVMRRSGHIRVDRNTATAAQALYAAADAVSAGSVVLVYPEGRIGLDPGMWPERGKTGTARLAFASGAAVVPVVQWGAHQVLPYCCNPKRLLRGAARALVRRPVIRVHFGSPVDLHHFQPGVPGAAFRATERIIDALTINLAPLRPDEPHLPQHLDPTRPVETRRTHPRRSMQSPTRRHAAAPPALARVAVSVGGEGSSADEAPDAA